MKQNEYSGKKVSTNEQIIVDYLKGVNVFNESDHYIIAKDCVYAKHKGAKIFLFYKEGNKVFYRFGENNKNHTKKILPLVGDDMELYLMHREITYPKVQKDVFNMVDKADMLHSMVYIYIEDKYYEIIKESGYDFLDILFKHIKDFDAEEEMFSEEMTKKIKKWTDPKIHSDYEWVAWFKKDAPTIELPNPYIELLPINLKRAYKINCLTS